MLASFLAETCRCLLAWVLLAAALSKLRALAAFRHNLQESFAVPPGASAPLAWAIVGAELLLAAGCASAPAPGYGAMALTLALFAGFTAVLAYRYWSTGLVRCACFGEAGRPVSSYDFLRNALLMAALVVYLACAGEAAALDSPLRWLAAALALPAALLAVHLHEVASVLLTAPEEAP